MGFVGEKDSACWTRKTWAKGPGKRCPFLPELAIDYLFKKLYKWYNFCSRYALVRVV
jgi:hypothetical protein